MSLHISQDIFDNAIQKLEANDIAGAWQVLADGGDRYAASAYNIIHEWKNLSLFLLRLFRLNGIDWLVLMWFRRNFLWLVNNT